MTTLCKQQHITSWMWETQKSGININETKYETKFETTGITLRILIDIQYVT